MDVVAVIAPEARLNQKASIGAAQQLAQQIDSFLPLLMFGCVEGIAHSCLQRARGARSSSSPGK